MSEDLNTPTGWMALCRCGERVASLDPDQLNDDDGIQKLSEWMSSGKIIFPVFGKKWPEKLRLTSCRCDQKAEKSSPE